MAAALRYAVTRLGGRALQRPQRNYNATADDIQSGRTVRPTSSRRSGGLLLALGHAEDYLLAPKSTSSNFPCHHDPIKENSILKCCTKLVPSDEHESHCCEACFSMRMQNLLWNLLVRKIKNTLQALSRRDNKKEELFHLIAKMDRELPSHCNRDNRQLLMQRSIFVQPKPDDPQWRFYRRALRCNNYVIYGWTLWLAYKALSN